MRTSGGNPFQSTILLFQRLCAHVPPTLGRYGRPIGRLRWVMAVSLLSLSMVCAVGAAGHAEEPARHVDLSLVLALDRSASVEPGRLRQQIEGMAAALQAPEVLRAIATGPRGRIATTVMLFAGPGETSVLVPWAVLDDAAAVTAFSEALLAASAPAPDGNTALGWAMYAAAKLFEESGVHADREVIDIAANGFNNAGVAPMRVGQLAAAEGLTVNGLAMVDRLPWLADYFQEEVIAGAGSFALAVAAPEDFTRAMVRKLTLEIVGRPTLSSYAELWP